MLFRMFTILAVAALAIFTWVLTSPGRRPVVVSANESDLPGYYLKHAQLTDYDLAGNPAVRLEAERVDQVGHTDQTVLTDVRLKYAPPDAEAWLLTGDRGHVESNSKIVDVEGNVILRGDPTGKRNDVPAIYTEYLKYDIGEGLVTTQAEVKAVFGSQTINATGLVANLKDQTLHLESKVNGRFHR